VTRDRPLEHRVAAGWAAHLDDLVAARVVMVIGAADAGKTTFTAWLANEWHARGLRAGIVDADVGQSEIGPPATVGLGAVRARLARPGDAEPVAFEFIGVTSPGRRPWQVAEATGRMAAAARARFDHVVVDTSGFVAGGFAAAVKQRKVGAVDPDVLVAIQAAEECEHILRGLAGRARPRVVRLPAVRGVPSRSPAVRREHRKAALARHFAGAGTIVLDTVRVPAHSVAGAPVTLADVGAGTLVALRNANAETVALGVIEGADAGRGTVTVRTRARPGDVAAIRVGETTLAG
jgi:polynucleotide 5'-hydroxyl-kinase GRC3/NOL9